MCKFTTCGAITFKKHLNTKRPDVPDCKVILTANNDDSSMEENYMHIFSVAMVKNGIMFVCNLCNTAIDNDSDLTKHMKEEHEKSLSFDKKFDQWTVCESWDYGKCMECVIERYHYVTVTVSLSLCH